MTVASTSPPLRRPRGDGALAALFVAPAMLGFLVFLLWPTLRGVYLSFTRFNLLTPAEWVGLDNYVRMVNDPIFWDSLTRHRRVRRRSTSACRRCRRSPSPCCSSG